MRKMQHWLAVLRLNMQFAARYQLSGIRFEQGTKMESLF